MRQKFVINTKSVRRLQQQEECLLVENIFTVP